MSQHEKMHSLHEFMDELHPEALGSYTSSGQKDGHFPCLALTSNAKDRLVSPCITISHLWFPQLMKTVKNVGTDAILPEFESLFCT